MDGGAGLFIQSTDVVPCREVETLCVCKVDSKCKDEWKTRQFAAYSCLAGFYQKSLVIFALYDFYFDFVINLTKNNILLAMAV